MKLLFISLICVSSVFASSRWSCKYDAEIIKIEKMETLNAEQSGNARTKKDEYTYMATLALTPTSTGHRSSASRGHRCGGQQKNVLLQEDAKYDYKVGDKLKVATGGVSDRSGYWSKYTVERAE